MNSQEFEQLNILVGIDLSEMDQHIIEYTEAIESILKPSKIVFLHNLKISELPKNLLTEDKLAIIIKNITHKIETQIQKKKPAYNYEIKIMTEAFSEIAFKSEAKKQKTNLLLLGNKQHLEGSGGLSQKLMRLLNCSTLLIPETAHLPIQKVISAVDFSTHTRSIINWAELFKNNSENEKIEHESLYISKFNWSLFPTMSDKELQKATLNDCSKKEKEWQTNYSDSSKLNIAVAGDKSIATVLLTQSNRTNADLIILGMQGITSITDLFIGSIANAVIQRPTDLALLLVKSTSKKK